MSDNFYMEALGNYASVQGGYAYKSEDFAKSGVPVLKIKNIRDREVDTSEVDYVSGDIASQTARYYVQPQDILISMTGSGIHAPDSLVGRVARYMGPKDYYLINQRVGRFVINKPERLDARYLFFVLAQPEYQWKLVSIATGSANQVNISGKQIESLMMPIPSVAEQRQIAGMLGLLDDKIELNHQINKTLEAIAQALFKSWFVDFDPVRAWMEGRQPYGMDAETAALFPDSFEDSVLGEIPRGWQVDTIGRLCKVAIGGDWGQEDPFEGAVESVCLRGVDLEHLRHDGWVNAPCRYVKRSSLQNRQMSNCDILVAASGIGPIGRSLWMNNSVIQIFSLPVTYSNFCKRLTASKPSHALYIDRLLFDIRESNEIWEYANGTSIPNLDINGLLSGRRIVVPSDNVLDRLLQFMTPIYEKLYSQESRSLAAIRDMLLPKLLSGEIRVKDAEKFVEAHI
jgi:type I restriction enzyme, S subunit